jgi:hypothetical protein
MKLVTLLTYRNWILLMLYSLLHHLHSATEVLNRRCDLVMRYEKSFGVSVYGGEPWKRGEIVDGSIGIPIPELTGSVSQGRNIQLANFIEGILSHVDLKILSNFQTYHIYTTSVMYQNTTRI